MLGSVTCILDTERGELELLGVSEKFDGKTEYGRYGDVIEEIDWSVGEILKTLKKIIWP